MLFKIPILCDNISVIAISNNPVRSVVFVEGGVEYKLYRFIEICLAHFNIFVRNKFIAEI